MSKITDVAPKLLTESEIKDGEIKLHGFTEEEAQQAYNLFRLSVLDGLIPLLKPIGFKYVSQDSDEDTAVVERHFACRENIVAVSRNIRKLIFTQDVESGLLVTSKPKKGPLHARDLEFISNRKEIKPLNGDLYIMNALDDLSLRFVVYSGTGLRSMEKNAEKVSNLLSSQSGNAGASYFPLLTDHSLVDYVRVLPLIDGHIRYKLNDISDEDFVRIWTKYLAKEVLR